MRRMLYLHWYSSVTVEMDAAGHQKVEVDRIERYILRKLT